MIRQVGPAVAQFLQNRVGTNCPTLCPNGLGKRLFVWCLWTFFVSLIAHFESWQTREVICKPAKKLVFLRVCFVRCGRVSPLSHVCGAHGGVSHRMAAICSSRIAVLSLNGTVSHRYRRSRGSSRCSRRQPGCRNRNHCGGEVQCPAAVRFRSRFARTCERIHRSASVPQIVAVLFCCGRHVEVPAVVFEMAEWMSGNDGGALFGQSVLSADQKSR